LENLLDGHLLAGIVIDRQVDHAECSIADHLVQRIIRFLLLLCCYRLL
jgi:hypothetical protein